MKNKKDALSDAIRTNYKDKLITKIYSFQLKDRSVKAVFSNNPEAPTIESALVKIATRRIS